MSREYDNTDRGVLFKNDRKEQDNHPDYKGSINVGGVEYWLSAWLREGENDKGRYRFMSLSVKPKEQRQAPQRRSPPPPRRRDPDEPF